MADEHCVRVHMYPNVAVDEWLLVFVPTELNPYIVAVSSHACLS